MIGNLDSITVRRLIKADRARVFAAFGRAEAIPLWLPPSPDITAEVLLFEFVPNGGFRVRFTMPGGSRAVVGGTYESITPPEQLVFSWTWEAPDPHADIPTRVLIRFLENGGSTEVVITHDRLPSKDARARYVDGWEGTLDNLERLLETGEHRAGDAPLSLPRTEPIQTR